MVSPVPPAIRAGQLLRGWRRQRRISQLTLACEVEVSSRHLSFVETGRARASRALLLRLGEVLELPLRERNRLLLAAGHAPAFPERDLGQPDMAAAGKVLGMVLAGHEPCPALVVDRHWNLVQANAAAMRLLQGLPESLRQPPINVLRVSLHPQGLAPQIINLAEWRHHLLARLRRLALAQQDAELKALLEELSAWPPLPGEHPPQSFESELPDVAMLFRLRSPLGELALIGTLTVFGSPLDVTLSELALEAFYPADEATATRLQQLAAADAG